MTNLEIYRELASRNKTPRIKKFMNLVSLGAFNNELLDLARADEREKLSKEIIKLRDTILAECCICCNNFDPSISRKEIVAIFNTFGIYNGFIEIPETEKGV